MMRTRTPQKSNRKTTKKNNNFDIALRFFEAVVARSIPETA